jgi:hypothetical protein
VRSRAGVRAAVALALGVLALECAVLAIMDARAVGARGEDWTGFLLLPIGIMLCGLAVAIGVTHRPRAAVEPGSLQLLEMRGYDGSEGDPNMFGWGATRDLDAAVAWLRRRPDVRDGRIGGIGLSVGGEQMLEAAAGNAGIRAVVSEGAGVRSVREHLLRGPRGWFTLPAEAVQTAALAVLSGTAPPPSLTELVARIAPRPILLVYAERGKGGEDLNPSYFEAAREPKTIWRVADGGHTGGITARPHVYERRVVGFFDRALDVAGGWRIDAPLRSRAWPMTRRLPREYASSSATSPM